MSGFKNIILWGIVAILIIALFNVFQRSASPNSVERLSYSDFLQKVEAGQIGSVKIDGEKVQGSYISGGGVGVGGGGGVEGGVGGNGGRFTTTAPKDSAYVDQLIAKGVSVDIIAEEENAFLSILLSLVSDVIADRDLGFVYAPDTIWRPAARWDLAARKPGF